MSAVNSVQVNYGTDYRGNGERNGIIQALLTGKYIFTTQGNKAYILGRCHVESDC